jgi:glutathione S-transferase
VFETAESAQDAARGADALLLLTEWNEFKSADLKELKSLLKIPLIFDGRNIFDPIKIIEYLLDLLYGHRLNSHQLYHLSRMLEYTHLLQSSYMCTQHYYNYHQLE